MATIHERPKLAYLRSDGAEPEPGLDLVVTLKDGQVLVRPLSPAEAARWLSQLSEFVERRFRRAEKA